MQRPAASSNAPASLVRRPGEVLDEQSSLVAIKGVDEIGASWQHGITGGDLEGAPQFADLAWEIAARLRGTVVAGHVIEFDLSHLRNELSRARVVLPDPDGATVRTRELAGSKLPPGPRSLSAVCTRLGISRSNAHTALGDAGTTASRFAAIVARGFDVRTGCAGERAAAWPEAPVQALEASTMPSRRSR